MHLSLLLFASTLISVASIPLSELKEVPPEVTAGFKYIDANELVRGLIGNPGDDYINFLMRQYDLCTLYYCHDDFKNSGCIGCCSDYIRHLDQKAAEDRFMHLNATKQPVHDWYACGTECADVCIDTKEERKACINECVPMCHNLLKYENRKEHETEFNELMFRLSQL